MNQNMRRYAIYTKYSIFHINRVTSHILMRLMLKIMKVQNIRFGVIHIKSYSQKRLKQITSILEEFILLLKIKLFLS